MTKQFSTSLFAALALAIAIVPGIAFKGIAKTNNSQRSILANASQISNEPKVVNSLHFQTLLPSEDIRIPPKESKTKVPVRLGVRITNNTNQATRIGWYEALVPYLESSEGKPVSFIGRNYALAADRSLNYPIILPGKSAEYFMEGNLFWVNNVLKLEVSDGFSTRYILENLSPGTYSFHFSYRILYSTTEIFKENNRRIEGIWVGQVETPFIQMHFSY